MANDFPDWTMVVAIAQNGVIGRQGDLPWRLSSDLQRFKKMTMGHCLLMGRKTFQSIGKALPGRQTIVLSRDGFSPQSPQVAVVSDLDSVLPLVEKGRRIMVVGGAEIYRLALPRCTTLWLTRVLENIQGDTLFPEIIWDDWRLESSESIPSGPRDECASEFQVWRRCLPASQENPSSMS